MKKSAGILFFVSLALAGCSDEPSAPSQTAAPSQAIASSQVAALASGVAVLPAARRSDKCFQYSPEALSLKYALSGTPSQEEIDAQKKAWSDHKCDANIPALEKAEGTMLSAIAGK